MAFGEPIGPSITGAVGGHCCVCSRVCHHVSPPSYCQTHAPAAAAPTTWPIPNVYPTTVITGTSTVSTATPTGAWIAYHGDMSSFLVFGREVDALRHAVEHSMDVRYVKWGDGWSSGAGWREGDGEEGE